MSGRSEGVASRGVLAGLMLALAGGVGCSGDKAAPVEDAANTVFAVQAEPVVSGPLFGTIHRLATDGRTLWVADFAGDPFLHAVDLATGQVRASVGRAGDGPGDYRSVLALLPARRAAAVWVFDPVGRRLTLVDSSARVVADDHSMVTLPASPRILAVARLGDRFVARAFSDDASRRMLLLGPSGQIVGGAVADLLGDETVPERQRQNASVNAALCARPDGTRFAVAFRYAGRIEIRDSLAGLVALAGVPVASNGDFQPNAQGQPVWHSGRAFYEDCAATDGHLFALFSGWDERDPERGQNVRESGYADRVHVFDWAGALVGSLALGQRVTSIMLDADRGVLYGAGTGTSTVYRFELPGEFRPGGR